MSRCLNFLVTLLLLCCFHARAQDRNLKELFQETERDTLWVRDLAINCYIYFEDLSRLDSLRILSEIVVSEANRLNFSWGQYHGNQLKGESFRATYPDSTIYYAKQGIAQLPEDDIRNLQVAYFNLGRAFRRFYQYDSAIHYLEKIIPMARSVGSRSMISDTYRLIGLIYSNHSKPIESINSYLKALTVGEELQDSTLISNSLLSIGIVYDDLKDYKKALDYMLRSAAIQEEMNRRAGNNGSIDRFLVNNIGRLYCKLGDYEEGMGYLYRDINSADRENAPCHYQYPSYNLGNTHLQLGNLDSARFYLQSALELANGCKDMYLSSLAAHDLGLVNDKEGNIPAAKKLYQDALKAAESRNAPSNELINAAYRLYEMSQAEGNYRKANQYLELWGSTKDSLFNLENSKQLVRMEMEFNFESEKRQLIAANERDQLVLENELQRRTIFQYALLAIAILILFIAINFYRSNQRRKKANEIIQQQNADLSASASQIRQLSSFKEGMIGMIAHDMKNSLNTILGLSKGGQSVDDKKANSIQIAGSNILNLVSNMLDVQKFEEAKVTLGKERSLMISLISRVKESLEPLLQSKSMVLTDDTSTIASMDVDPEIIYRVLINLITNSIKYSSAGSRVIIRAQPEPDGSGNNAVISVIDEGIGVDEKFLPNLFDKFTQSEARSLGDTGSSGLGLHFCKLAIDAHGGEIWASSNADKGLTISFSIPIGTQNLSSPKTTLDFHENGEVSTVDVDNKEGELKLVRPYLERFSTLKVYQIKQIKALITQMEAENINTQWQKDLWSATLHGNQEMFDSLLKKV